MKILRHILMPAAMMAVLSLPFSAPAQTTATSKDTAAKTTKAKTSAPSAADIADAKSKGLVWVNTNTKVYHKSDDKYYGTTKAGKFMTEADAQKAGYHLAKESPIGKKKTTSSK